MDILFTGLICLAIAITDLVAGSNPAIPANVPTILQGLLIIVGFYLVVAGFFKRLEAKREEQVAAPLSARNEVLRQTQLPDLLAKEEKLRHAQANLAAAEKREAETVLKLSAASEENRKLKAAESKPVVPKPTDESMQSRDAEIVSFLSILQQKGRLVDFLMDDITPYPDAQVGAAARVVHQGCSSVIRDYFDLAPVQSNSEGSDITLESDYQTARYRLVGRVVGTPPFKGVLVHRGWVANKVALPRLISDTPELAHDIIAPAEVELR